MKKLATIIGVVMSFALQASAQAEIGIKGGLNYVTVIEKIRDPQPLVPYNRNSFTYRPAFHAGFYGIFNYNGQWSFNPELLYSLKGAKRSVNNRNETYDFHYVSAPILIGFKPVEQLQILAGAEVGILLHNIHHTEAASSKLDNIFINPVEIGAVLGARFFVNERVRLGIRYTYSFNSALANIDVTLSDPQGQQIGPTTLLYRNSTFQLSVAYSLWKQIEQ